MGADEHNVGSWYLTNRYAIFDELLPSIFGAVHPYSADDASYITLPDISLETHILPALKDNDIFECPLFYECGYSSPQDIGDDDLVFWVKNGDHGLKESHATAFVLVYLASLTNISTIAKIFIDCLEEIDSLFSTLKNKGENAQIDDEQIFEYFDKLATTLVNNASDHGTITFFSNNEESDCFRWTKSALRKHFLNIGLGIPPAPTLEQTLAEENVLDEEILSSTRKGHDYECECAEILEDSGFQVRRSPASGDQGADLICEKHGIRYVVQCKDTAKVGNKAVQEVLASSRHYNADHAAVVTSGSYTNAAKRLANSNEVAVLNTGQLKDIEVFFRFD